MANNVEFKISISLKMLKPKISTRDLVLAGTSLFYNVTQQIKYRNQVLYLRAVTVSVADTTEVLPNDDTTLLNLRPVQPNLTWISKHLQFLNHSLSAYVEVLYVVFQTEKWLMIFSENLISWHVLKRFRDRWYFQFVKTQLFSFCTF
jgi:hypothetical protein